MHDEFGVRHPQGTLLPVPEATSPGPQEGVLLLQGPSDLHRPRRVGPGQGAGHRTHGGREAADWAREWRPRRRRLQPHPPLTPLPRHSQPLPLLPSPVTPSPLTE